jgi:hypothetical protein
MFGQLLLLGRSIAMLREQKAGTRANGRTSPSLTRTIQAMRRIRGLAERPQLRGATFPPGRQG